MLGSASADESGSTLPEYTVLIAIILIAVIVSVAIVGDWLADKWQLLHQRLEGN